MNKFITAIKQLNLAEVDDLLKIKPAWAQWAEEDGKNALHYLCGGEIAKQPGKEASSLQLLQLLLKNAMDINAVHRVKDGCGIFPATPLWYAYTRGRNKTLYTWLLANGADPQHCMYAIAWYDDAEAAALFSHYGAIIDDHSAGDTPFLAAYNWKRLHIAEWFLKNGADVNAADTSGNTALFYAVKRKHPVENIRLLLKYGADIDQENKEGISPKKLAELNRQKKMLELFGQ